MDIKYINNDFHFFYRVSAVILNKTADKILLFNIEGRKFYMLPGGKVNELETSLEALKRELKEETGLTNFDFSYIATSEEIINDKGYNNHSINLIYKAIYKDNISETKFKGLEGDWINFEWIDIKDTDKYIIHPNGLKEILNNNNKLYHFIERKINE